MTRTQRKLAVKRYRKMALRIAEDLDKFGFDYEACLALLLQAKGALQAAAHKLESGLELSQQEQQQEAA